MSDDTKHSKISLYDKFKTDENLEAGEGVELDYGDAGAIIIHRAGGANKRYRDLGQKRMRSYQRRIEAGTITDDEANKLLIGIYADSVVIGWRDIVDEEGNPLPFSRDNVVKLFTDLPELFEDVREAATSRGLFASEMVEADKGNS